jgi:hypothetical protein
MKLVSTVRDSLDYLFAAAGRIFSRDRDEYPSTGYQPFQGDIIRKKQRRHPQW